MTTRDRLVICILVAAALLAGFFIAVVNPKRKDATALGTQVATAQNTLVAAQAQVSQGRAAALTYGQNLRTVAALFRAVPSNEGVPKLLVALDRTSHHKRVDFQVVSVSQGAGGAPTAGAVAAGGGFQTVNFTFTFNGNYISLQNFLHALDRYTLVNASGGVVARGRLLTIQSVGLTPTPGGAQASITATAYSETPAAGTAAGGVPSPTPAALPVLPATGATGGTGGSGATGGTGASAPAPVTTTPAVGATR